MTRRWGYARTARHRRRRTSRPYSKSSDRAPVSGLRVSQKGRSASGRGTGTGPVAGPARPEKSPGEVLSMARDRGLDRICESAEVAGPGFINLTLSGEFLAGELRKMAADPATLGVPKSSPRLKVVVDYASPNAAKQMHVGHLRSTIIGDSLVRLLQFVGHTVVRENHIGDWGLPFGMLIEHLIDLGEERGAYMNEPWANSRNFTKQARAAYDSDPSFCRARSCTGGPVAIRRRGDAPPVALARPPERELFRRAVPPTGDEAHARRHCRRKLLQLDVAGRRPRPGRKGPSGRKRWRAMRFPSRAHQSRG